MLTGETEAETDENTPPVLEAEDAKGPKGKVTSIKKTG
jgi:hypothetical protein